jgi:hypothetical protein
MARFIIFTGGCWSTKIVKNDYSYEAYLGPDYKDQPIPEHIPTYVSNHTSWLDVEVLIKNFTPAFAAKESLRNVPVFGLLCEYLGCIFISRGGTEE